MAILALGISHRRAAVELLERLAFADEDLVKAYRRTADDAAIDEAVIVSTCNRVEIYGSVPSYHAGFQALKRVLCESRGVAPEDLAEPLYSHYESDAAEHLFTVASGLDSMVLGEPQILSQVREALRRAEGERASGPSLTAAVQRGGRRRASGPLRDRARRGPRRVRRRRGRPGRRGARRPRGPARGRDRRRTDVGARREAPPPARRRRRSASSTDRSNAPAPWPNARRPNPATSRSCPARSPRPTSRSRRPAPRSSCSPRRWCATRSTGAERPLFVLDLAVPRDVEPAAGRIAGVTLVDIDGLRASVSVRAAETAADIERAHAIVAGRGPAVHDPPPRRRLGPLFRALRERGDAAVDAELERFRSDLARSRAAGARGGRRRSPGASSRSCSTSRSFG